MNPMNNEQTIAHRLRIAFGDMTYKQLGELTDTHPETVRRYMNGYAPSSSFLANASTQFGISGDWLLSGRGPMLSQDITKHVIENAEPQTLMNAVTQHFLNVSETTSPH